MSEASLISTPEKYQASLNAISSPESEDGQKLCASPNGQITDLFGQALAPVSPGATPGKVRAILTSATYGRHGFGSSASAALQLSLASRLQELMAWRGSTAFSLTWKTIRTPSRRQICQLRALALHKDDRGSGSWQTPTTRDGKGQSGKGNRMRRGKNGRLHVANLCDQIVDLGRPDLVRSTEFRCWLMGFPMSWEAARPTATQSSRRSPKPSSEPQ
jgi:hypothetical protein